MAAIFVAACGARGTSAGRDCGDGQADVDNVCVSQRIADYVACVRAQGAQLGTDRSTQLSADVGYEAAKVAGVAELKDVMEKRYSVSEASEFEIIRTCAVAAGIETATAGAAADASAPRKTNPETGTEATAADATPADGLGTEWHVLQSGASGWKGSGNEFRGEWTRRGTTDLWDAKWGDAGGLAPGTGWGWMAVVTTSRRGDKVRAELRGTDVCAYDGTLQDNGYEVAGTCSCETNGSFPFKAIIQPADGLGTVWDEIENGYEGVWTRRGTGDTWEGRWGGSYTALLTITRGTDGAIRVDRRGADNCVYKGSIASDGVTVAGTFECEINKGPYTFKAVVRW